MQQSKSLVEQSTSPVEGNSLQLWTIGNRWSPILYGGNIDSNADYQALSLHGPPIMEIRIQSIWHQWSSHLGNLARQYLIYYLRHSHSYPEAEEGNNPAWRVTSWQHAIKTLDGHQVVAGNYVYYR